MSNWNYVREESTNVAAGDHRFEVVSAEEKVSKSGKNMIVVSLKPNGASFTVNDYIVEGEYFNRKMTQFFDSTGIEEGNFNLLTWVGAVGAARFKEDENGYLKVQYYLDPKRAEKLPPWVGDMPQRQTVTTLGGDLEGAEPLDPEDDPF
jgi:hypothetical protein